MIWLFSVPSDPVVTTVVIIVIHTDGSDVDASCFIEIVLNPE